VTSKGTFPGDDKLSNVTLRDVLLDQHRSIRQKIGIDDRIDSDLNGRRAAVAFTLRHRSHFGDRALRDGWLCPIDLAGFEAIPPR
jgi:hypothetical protein